METTVTVERVDEDTEFLPSQEILRENLKKKPSRKKPAKLFTELRCGQCGKILSDRSSLRNHIQTHSTACPYQCRLCSYKGKTRKYLLRHMNRAHREPSKLVNCGYCDKTFRFMSKLKVHERVHTGEKPYKCDVCGKAFNSAYSLSTHNFIHTDEKPFKCSFCDYACRDSSTLRKHQERHLGLKRHKCQICTKRYDSKSVLEAHIREIHTAPEARNHACGQCDSTFRNKWALQRHMALVHERKKACECSVCGKHIPNSYNLSAHMRSHVDVRPYKCTYNGCKASFKNKSDLKKHTSIHYPQKQVACDHCGKLFSRKNRLMKHILKIHDAPNTKSERCEYCGVSFLTKNYLSKHIRMKHARNRQNYICDMCDFETHNKPSIVMHIKHGHDHSNKKCLEFTKKLKMETTVTVERVDEDSEFLPSQEILRENLKKKPSRKKPAKLFTELRCGQCGKILSDRSSLRNHIQTHSTACPFQCRLCSYKGKTRKYLLRHMNRAHREPSKLVNCGYCDKTFRFMSKLKVHERVHTGEKPYKCDVCGKAFNSAYSLSTHNFIHTDEKPFKCTFCDYACRDSSTLRKHQERHLGLKRHKCQMCTKRYDSKSVLEAHIREIHTAPEARNHACGQCDSTFRNKWALQRHMALVHERKKACECSVCGKHIPNSYNLSAHMRSHVDVRPYKCTYNGCKASFKNKPFEEKCSVCGKHIPNSYNLSAHMRSHVDVRPYKCTYNGCKASFKNKSDLKKHTSIHYPQKQVACDHCGKLFSRKNRLMKHILKIHDAPNTKSERCEYCGVSFLTKNYLSKHIRMKHARNRQKYICDMCDFETHNKPSIVMHIKHGHDYSNKTKCTICGKTYKREVALKLHYKSSHNIQFKTKSRTLPKIQIKEEPLDPVPDLEIDLLDIGKEEPFADVSGFETEYSEDISKIYQPSDDKDQRLHELFRRMIHDPDYELNGNSETPYETNTTKVENRTPEPAHSAMPLEELIQQDLVLLVVGERRPMSRRESTNNTTEAETRTDDPPQNIPAPPENIEQVVSDEQSTLNENELTESNNNTTEARIEESPNTTEETQPEGTTESPTNMPEAETRTEGTTKSPTNMPEAETRTEGTTESPTNMPEAETRTENTTKSPTNMPEAETRTETVQTAMPVEEFIQRVVGDEEDRQDIDETYIIDKESDMFLKQRIKELIMNQRLVDQIRRTDYGRRTLKRVAHDEAKLVKPRKKVSQPKSYQVNTETKKQTKIIKERKTRRKRIKRKNDRNKTDSNDNGEKRESNLKKDAKLIFNSFECNVCYKLFETKPKLLEHCQIHFEICSESTLIKCPLCNFVADKDIKKHFKTVHHEDISISFTRILDRKDNESGSRYYYNTQNDKAKEMDIIPSVKILNKKAGMDLDKRNREKNNKLIATPKLVKKGNEWIVAKQKFDLSGYVLPNSKELDKDDEDYLKKLKKLGIEAKDKGVKMLYPCNKCEKICQNLSALTLHSRKHNPDKKPFAPKVWKHKIKDTGNKNTGNSQNNINNVTKDINNRTAKPKPIVHKHKCDPKLIEFYETNIRGLNIEFWQFLKIYNKMDRDNVNDFEDLQNSDDYGLGHRNYLEEKQPSNDCNSNVDNNENTKMNTKSNNTHNKNKKSLSVASRKGNVANVKNNFTRTIRISRTEHNKRMQVQKKLREKLTQTGNV